MCDSMAYSGKKNKEGGGSCSWLNNGGGDMMKPSASPVAPAFLKTMATVGDRTASTIDGKTEK